jgi:hypothetical protein
MKRDITPHPWEARLPPHFVTDPLSCCPLVTLSPPPVTTWAEYRPPCSGCRASCFATGPPGLHVPPRLSCVPATLTLIPHS